MEQDKIVVNRVIHHLSGDGGVVRIGYEPAAFSASREICLHQTHHLMDCANAMIASIDRWHAPTLDRGYHRAMDDLKRSEHTRRLREATIDLRPHLAAMASAVAGGIPIPSHTPEFYMQRRYRRQA